MALPGNTGAIYFPLGLIQVSEKKHPRTDEKNCRVHFWDALFRRAQAQP